MTSTHMLSFTHDEWSALAKNSPLPLTHADVRHLKALGDPIGLSEADAIYRPLSALLQMYTREMGDLHRATSEFLGIHEDRTPFIIGIAGSVAVGKSTTARLLQALLRRWPLTPKVELVTTDGFLYPNAVLEANGLMERKGFPESYDQDALTDFVRQVKSGKSHVTAPMYDHVTYDIVPDQMLTVHHPDILILEGLNVLQPAILRPEDPPNKLRTVVSDFFDMSIYVDAEPEDLERWYLDRQFKLRDIAFSEPGAYFHQFADMPDDELRDRSREIWRTINLPNLLENIEPTRARADITLRKGPTHRVEEVLLRKL